MAERITGHTELIGLMAYPIRHSSSPAMHNEARRGKIKKDGTQGRKNRRSKFAGDRRGYIHAAGRACLRHKRKGRYE